MTKVNVADIKAKLSEFLTRAEQGERIVICRHNTPVAELRALAASRIDPRPVGPLPDRPTFDIPPSFFEPLPDDELELWEGAPPATPGDRAPQVAEAKSVYAARAKKTRPRRRS